MNEFFICKNAQFSPISFWVVLNSSSKQTHNSQFAVCLLCYKIYLTTFPDLALSVDSCYLLITFTLLWLQEKFFHVLFLLFLRYGISQRQNFWFAQKSISVFEGFVRKAEFLSIFYLKKNIYEKKTHLTCIFHSEVFFIHAVNFSLKKSPMYAKQIKESISSVFCFCKIQML